MDNEQKVENQEPKQESKAWALIKRFFKNLWKNIILPCFKDMIFGMASTGARTFQNGVSNALYHTTYPVSEPTRSTYRNDPTFPTARSPISNVGTISRQLYPNRYGVYQLCARDRRSLELIMAKMQARINDPASQGTISVGEMYAFAALPATAEDYNMGWTSLAGCAVIMNTTDNMYVLEMVEQRGL